VLAAGAARAGELRHPERAAAWLRSRVVDALRRAPEGRIHTPAERRAVLLGLGTPEASVAALEGLSLEDRAALVAGSVERFTLTDVAVILGRDPSTARRILHAARRRYLAEADHWMADLPAAATPGGEIAERVERVAAGAMGRQASEPPA
jgi:DNA-directed RNA polymerase specialized sigma24 family protein